MLLCEYFLEVHSLNRFCGCELMSVILSSKVLLVFQVHHFAVVLSTQQGISFYNSPEMH
jgi:hypothetical protein